MCSCWGSLQTILVNWMITRNNKELGFNLFFKLILVQTKQKTEGHNSDEHVKTRSGNFQTSGDKWSKSFYSSKWLPSLLDVISLISLNYIPVMLEELRLSRPARRRRLFQRLGASKAARRVNLMIRLLEHGLREAALQARAVSGN